MIKRLFFVLTLCALYCTANAQAGETTFGVKAGMTISNMTSEMNGDAKCGAILGVTMDYGITNDIYLLSGLNFVMKGTREDDVKFPFSYLQIPIHAGYKFALAPDLSLTLHAGPYIACALSGKMKTDGISVNLYNKNIQNENGLKMRRFDLGLGFGANLDWQQFCFGFNFDGGLINMIKDAKIKEGNWSNVKAHNVSAELTVGYKF